jgi:hypothetical protein
MASFAPTTARFYKNVIITLVFEKKVNVFTENWQRSQKIVIVTLTPGRKRTSQAQIATLFMYIEQELTADNWLHTRYHRKASAYFCLVRNEQVARRKLAHFGQKLKS